MIPPAGSIIYVDTNVWAYHFIPSGHRYSPACKRFLARIAGGSLRAAVSSFVLQELFAVSLRAECQARGSALTDAEMRTLRLELVKKIREFGAQIHPSDDLAALPGPNALFERSQHIVETSAALEDPASASNVRWKSVSASDALHCSLAERIGGVASIATCDYGLKKMVSALPIVFVPEDFA